MTRRAQAIPRIWVVLAVVLAAVLGPAALASATPPVLLSAVSRMIHGTAGAFDIQLPLTGNSGIECRSVSAGMTLVLSFDQPVTGGTAAITTGTAAVNGTPTFSGSTMSVNLANVPNAQSLVLTVSNVTNAASEKLLSVTVPFRTLFGDVNANGVLTGSDVNLCKYQVAINAPVTGANFRCDSNINGLLTGSDVNLIKAAVASNAIVTGGTTTDTAPTITDVANQTTVTGVASSPVGFTVNDAESDPSTLAVVATTSDPVTLPLSGIAITGTGTSRTIVMTPTAGISTVTVVTITLASSDGLMSSAPITFTLTVTPPPTTFLATLAPIAGVNTLGTGTATLVVSGDQTHANLKYSYSNLAGVETDTQVYAPGDVGLFDVPTLATAKNVQTDGSILWTFNVNTAASTLATITSNTAYLTVASSANAAGELRGTFQKVNGSQTFTPPGAPPAITINPPTASDASRFLQQAAFGGKTTEITTLSNTGAANASTALNDWINAQFALPLPISPTYDAASPTYSSSSMYKQIYDRVTTAQSPNVFGDSLSDDRIHEVWWKNAVTAPDQLRQRVTTALSELFVVSEIDDNIDGNIPGLASYYDMLANDAFGNFRTILGDVTLHPIMGDYLNMRGNNKATLPAVPNENYAREIMQLFTIGLYMLQPDGTLLLDANGQPIPTYSQTDITNFSQVYTGWNTNGTAVVIPTLVSDGNTPPAGVVSNFNSFYQKPMVVNASQHSVYQKTLLNYTGAAVFPGATLPGVIPANASQTSTTATAELNFALNNIFNHPNVGPFVCKQLIQRLIGSNPSPAYVYRVAQVFNNNGSGVRGDMKAVITAILTDYEARSTALINDPGYGHMREPMIRMANIMRSLNATSKSGKWQVGKTDNALAQTIFRSPTVFNFFHPAYVQPGVVQTAGIVSPEFDIIYETTITNAQNMIYTGIYANYQTNGSSAVTATTGTPLLTGTGFRGDAFGSDVYLDFSSATGCGLVSLASTGGSTALIDQVGLLLMGTSGSGGPNPMNSSMRTRINTFLTTSLPASNANYLPQVEATVHLVASASQASVQK